MEVSVDNSELTVSQACFGLCDIRNLSMRFALSEAHDYVLETPPEETPPEVIARVEGYCPGYSDFFIGGLFCNLQMECTIEPVDM